MIKIEEAIEQNGFIDSSKPDIEQFLKWHRVIYTRVLATETTFNYILGFNH